MLPGKFFLSGKFLKKDAKRKYLPLRKTHYKTEPLLKILNISGQSGIFPDSLEDSQTVLKIFRQFERQSERLSYSLGNFLDSLEDFPKVCKILRQSGRFSDSLEDFQTVLKIFQQSVRCTEC